MSDRTIRIHYAVDTSQAEQALNDIETRDAQVREKIKETSIISSATAAKAVALMSLGQAALMNFLNLAGIQLNAVQRATIQQAFMMAQMYTYMASANLSAGQFHAAAVLFGASAFISITAAQMQQEGESNLASLWRTQGTLAKQIGSYGRLGYLGG